MNIRNWCVTSVLALALVGCAVNPVTGKRELSLVSPEQEVAIGQQQYGPSQQSQGGRYYLDPDLQVYVRGIGQKLAAVSHSPNLPYEFVVLNNPVPNAWALPGGKIAVNSGLLMELDNEAELAAVLGHEIVHAAARHGASQMTRGQLLNLGVGILGVATAGSDYGQLANVASQFGAAAWMARYGREDELESDAYGMEYMAKVGYDPMGAVTLQQTFVRLSEGRDQGGMAALFASHPPSQQRVDENRAKAKTLPGGNLYRERYQRAIAQLKRDAPAYKAQAEAAKALKNKDGKAALAHLDEAIRIQPREGQFWEYRGHAWNMLKNYDNAATAYGTAISKNPDYFAPYLYRGMVRVEQKKYAEAKPDITKAHSILPNATSAYYLGEIAYQQGDSKTAANYFKQVAEAGGEVGKKAQERLLEMQLKDNPAALIQHRLVLNNQGYLVVMLYNSAPVALTDVVVQVSDGVRSRQINAGKIGARQQVNLPTEIGPFTDAGQAGNLRAAVTSARAQ